MNTKHQYIKHIRQLIALLLLVVGFTSATGADHIVPVTNVLKFNASDFNDPAILNSSNQVPTGYYLPVSDAADNEEYYVYFSANRGTGTNNGKFYVCVKISQGIGIRLLANSKYIFTVNYYGIGDASRDRGLTIKTGPQISTSTVVSGAENWVGMSAEHTKTIEIETGSDDANYWILGTDDQNGGGETHLYSFSVMRISESCPDLRTVEIDGDYLWYSSGTLAANSLYGMSGYNNGDNKLYFFNNLDEPFAPNGRYAYINNKGKYQGLNLGTSTVGGYPGAGIGFRIAQGKKAKVRILATYPNETDASTVTKGLYLVKGDDYLSTSYNVIRNDGSLNGDETYLVVREYDVTSDLTSQAQTYWVTGFVSVVGLEILFDNNPTPYDVSTLAALPLGTHNVWFQDYQANQVFNMGYLTSDHYDYHLGNDRVSNGSKHSDHYTYEWTSNDAVGFKVPNNRRANVTIYFKKRYDSQGIADPGFNLIKGNTYSSSTTPESTVKLGAGNENTNADQTMTFESVDNTTGEDMVLWISGISSWDSYLLAGYQVELIDITPIEVNTTPITDDYVWNGTSSTTLTANAAFGGGYLGNNGAYKAPVRDGSNVRTTTVNGAAHTLYDFSADGETISLTLADDIEGEIRVYYATAASGNTTPVISKGDDLLGATAITGLSAQTQEGTNYYSYKFTSADPRSSFISGGLIAGVEVLVHNKDTFAASDMTVTTKGEIKDIYGNNFTWKPLDTDNNTITDEDQVLGGNRYYTYWVEKRQYFFGDDRVVSDHTVAGNRAVVIDENYKQGFLLEKGSKYRITIYWARIVEGEGSIAFKHGTDPASLTTYDEYFYSQPGTYTFDLRNQENNEMVWITGGQSKVYYAGFKLEVMNDYQIVFETDAPGIFTGTYNNKLLIYCTDNGTQENYVVPTAYYKHEYEYTDITNTPLTYEGTTYPSFHVENTYSAADGSENTQPGFAATPSPSKESLYLQDFSAIDNSVTNKLNGWEAPDNFPGMSIEGIDDSYLHIQGNVSGSRTYRTNWGTGVYGSGYSNVQGGTYTVSFDFNFERGPNDFDNQTTSISLVSNIWPANKSIFRTDYQLAEDNRTKVGYLFDLTWDNTIHEYSNMTFVVNGNDNERVRLQSTEWYTFTIEVNVNSRTVGYKITTREGAIVAVGQRDVPTSQEGTTVDMYAQGLNLCLSRNWARFNFDNIEVSTQSMANPDYIYTVRGFEDTDQDKLYKVTYRYATGNADEPYVEDYYYLWYANFLKMGWWVNRDAKLIVGSNNSASDPNHIIIGDFYVSSGSTGNFFYDAFDPTYFTGATWKYTNDQKREVTGKIDYDGNESWTKMNDEVHHGGSSIQLGYPSKDNLRDYWSTEDGGVRIYDPEVVKTVDFTAKRTGWPDWTVKVRFRFVPAPTLNIESYYKDGTRQGTETYDASYTSAKVEMKAYNGVTGGPVVDNATIYYTTDGSTPTVENNTATNATYVYNDSDKPENTYAAVYYAAEYIKTPMVFYINNPFTTYIEGMSFVDMMSTRNQSQNFVARSKMLSVPVRDLKVEHLDSDYKFARTKTDGTLKKSGQAAAVDGGFEYKYPFDHSASNPVQMSVLFGHKDTECYRENKFLKVGAKWINDTNNTYDEFLDYDLYKYKTIGENYESGGTTQNGNPQTECNGGLGGPDTENGGMFLQPIAGDFLRFEPEYDGVITVWMRTNGAGQSDEVQGNITRRPVYIVDENGVVMKRSTVKPSTEHFFSLNGTYAEINSIKSLIRQDCRIDWLNGLDHWKRGYKGGTTPMDLRFKATYKIFNYWYGYPLYQNMNALGHTNSTTGKDAEYFRHTMDVADSWISRTAMVQSVMNPYNSILYHSENIYNNIATGSKAVTFYDGTMEKDGGNYKTRTIWDGDKFARYGYELPAFNVVRYRFPVKAGKSYYIGGRGTKNGFLAMKFDKLEVNYDPATYNHADNRTIIEADYSCTSVSGAANKTYEATAIDNSYLASGETSYSRIHTYHLYEAYDAGNQDLLNHTPTSWANAQQGTTCNVTVHRTFKPGRWYAIVLPFSVSETRMKKIFGENVQVLYLDPYAKTLSTGGDYKSAVYPAVRQKGSVPRLIFTYHKYQMLYANTPAFICPDPDLGHDVEDYTFERVTIDKTNLGPSKSYSNIGYKIGEIGGYEYYVVGSYNQTTAAKNGEMYYLDNLEDATGKFTATMYHSQTGVAMKGTRCWIVPVAKTAVTKPGQKAPLLMEIGYNDFTGEDYDIENTVTAIHDIVMDDTSADMYNDGGVYDMMGRKVGEGSLDGLLPGVYIYQGRKIYIR